MLGEVGRGGMGTVYRARHDLSGQVVALKLLAAHLRGDPELARRFLREPSLYPQHPNIVQIYDAGVCDGAPYFAMQLIEGYSLDQKLKTGQKLDCPEVSRITQDVAAALDAAHARGIIHRDIKPGNILIRAEDGRAFLTDFGVARDAAAPTTINASGGSRIGTAWYMSPEQAKGLPVLTPATDVYALGVVCYHMLSGAPPFMADSDVAVLRMHIDEPPPDPRKAGLSAEVSRVLQKALAKRPEARYQTAGAFAQELARACKQAAAPLAAASAKPAAAKASAPLLLAGVGLVALLMGIAGAALGNLIIRPQPSSNAAPAGMATAAPSVTAISAEGASAAQVASPAPPATVTLAPAVTLISVSPTPPAAATSTPAQASTPAGRPTSVAVKTATPQSNAFLAAPRLLAPQAGFAYSGDIPPSFSWTSAGVLAADEYYVFALSHAQGVDEQWVKGTSAQAPAYVRSLRPSAWNVTIRRKTGVKANGAPDGPVLVAAGERRLFSWSEAGPASPGSSPLPRP